MQYLQLIICDLPLKYPIVIVDIFLDQAYIRIKGNLVITPPNMANNPDEQSLSELLAKKILTCLRKTPPLEIDKSSAN